MSREDRRRVDVGGRGRERRGGGRGEIGGDCECVWRMKRIQVTVEERERLSVR